MHAWLAFLGGVCAAFGVLLLLSGLSGLVYFGLGAQTQLVIGVTALFIAAIVALMLFAVIRVRHRRIKTGVEALIGARGMAVTDLKPQGTVRVVGEFWRATVARGGNWVGEGELVEVLGLEGMLVVVRSAKEKA
jgi:membrane-bound serine protease (ClpP class)